MVGEGVTMSPMSYNTTIVVRIRQLGDSATLRIRQYVRMIILCDMML